MNIDLIKKLEKKALEEKIEQEYKKQEKQNEQYESSRLQRLADMENGKKLAEQKFPLKLQELESSIKYEINYGKRSVRFACGLNDLWATQYLQIMFTQTLPLQGMSCKIIDSFIDVGW